MRNIHKLPAIMNQQHSEINSKHGHTAIDKTPLAKRSGVYTAWPIDGFNHSPSELCVNVIIILELDSSPYCHIPIREAGFDF